MQSIVCKYLGPTYTKGARVKAICAAGTLTVGYHSSDRDDPYLDAAEGLCKKLGWVSAPSHLYTSLIRGDLPNGDVVFTFMPIEYHRAKQAIFETRLAIAKGENNGNPHGRPWGKAITQLTDGEVGAFNADYETFKAINWDRVKP